MYLMEHPDFMRLVEVYRELAERLANLERDVGFLRRQIEARRIVQEDYIKTKDKMLGQQDFD